MSDLFQAEKGACYDYAPHGHSDKSYHSYLKKLLRYVCDFEDARCLHSLAHTHNFLEVEALSLLAGYAKSEDEMLSVYCLAHLGSPVHTKMAEKLQIAKSDYVRELFQSICKREYLQALCAVT
ncbi:MAG: hypothetical protein LBN05_08445 [Oscillospiraceae bacterium]|nr:hypothetical protein [Oscillospiraceae bacterium]